MSTYVVQTTPVQDAALELLVADINREAAVRGQSPWTVQSYVLARLGDVLTSYSEQYAGRILGAAQAVYPTLSPEQRGRVLTLLGRPSFVALPPEDQLAALVALAPSDFRLLPPDQQGLILQVLGLLPASPA